MATLKGHGGRRTGAGRPRVRPKTLPWQLIRRAAANRATEAEIISALRIPDSALADPAVPARFREEISIAHARHDLELRHSIRRRGLRTTRHAGSVNALAMQARNSLDWDRQVPAEEGEPDLATSRQRLRDMLMRLAEARSEVEGRPVTALELLYRGRRARGLSGPGASL
jgi:hypothetical protein